MLTPRQAGALSWHPLKDVGARGPNYALSLLGTREGRLQYLMACGHESVLGHAQCPRGCKTAPNYRMPYTRYESMRLAARRMDRYGVKVREDLTRLPLDLRPPQAYIDGVMDPITAYRRGPQTRRVA